jgi:hypothetical protein
MRAVMAWKRSNSMPTVEERVAYLEGRLEDHVASIGHLRSDTQQLGENVRVLRERMDQRFDTLDAKVDRHFTWVVGIQLALLVSVVGALVGAYYR